MGRVITKEMKIRGAAKRGRKVLVRYKDTREFVKGRAFMSSAGPKLWYSSSNIMSLDPAVVEEIKRA